MFVPDGHWLDASGCTDQGPLSKEPRYKHLQVLGKAGMWNTVGIYAHAKENIDTDVLMFDYGELKKFYRTADWAKWDIILEGFRCTIPVYDFDGRGNIDDIEVIDRAGILMISMSIDDINARAVRYQMTLC